MCIPTGIQCRPGQPSTSDCLARKNVVFRRHVVHAVQVVRRRCWCPISFIASFTHGMQSNAARGRRVERCQRRGDVHWHFAKLP